MLKTIRKFGALTIFPILLGLCLFSSCGSAPKGAPPVFDQVPGDLSRVQASENINDNRMITYSVSMELSVKDTEETRKMLLEQVQNENGFIIKDTDNYVSARIPSENMDNFIVASRTLGKVENETKTGTDITDQYRDNLIRLDSLRNIRDRYMALLEKANSVSDILSIEKELERINTEIEVMEGRIKYAELSVAYANITVRFKEKVKPGPLGWIFYGLYRGIKWLFVWN